MSQPRVRRLAHRNLIISATASTLLACSSVAVSDRPTPEPVVRITPAPTQNIGGTQTAFAAQSIPTPTPQGLYIVKPGDTLGSIADNFETTVDEIIAQNGIADPNRIEVGQQLIIPSLLTATSESGESSTQTP
jgi:LysM repeat protein